MWEERMVCDYDVSPNVSILHDLTKQQRVQSDELSLSERWDVEQLLGRSVTDEVPVAFLEMLPLWVGKGALKNVSEARIYEYRNFLELFDLHKGFDDLLQVRLNEKSDIAEHDLGPIQDYLLLSRAISENCQKERTVILEVGGGYGRLAELFTINRPKGQCYVLTDSVPESVFYSWRYLSQRCKGMRVGAYFLGDKYAPNDWDIYVVPAWRLKEVVSDVDVAINVASIQEMPDATANAYLKFFQEKLNIGGIFFFQNSRDFCSQREYTFPPEWRYLIKKDTPRSRTLDYPLEILKVEEHPADKHNLKVVSDYYVSLKHKAKSNLAELEALRLSERQKYLDSLKDRARQISDLSKKYKDMYHKKNELISSVREGGEEKLKKLKNVYEKRISVLSGRVEQFVERLKGEASKRESLMEKYRSLQDAHRTAVENLKSSLEAQKKARQIVADRLSDEVARRRELLEKHKSSQKLYKETISNLKGKLSSAMHELREAKKVNVEQASIISRMSTLVDNGKKVSK